MPNCRKKLLGIQLVYCDGSNKKQTMWVNLQQVHALAWCEESVGAKSAGKTGSNKIPQDPNGPGDCPKPRPDVDQSICWWNGSDWVCGDE
ncbi:MAG TPA: hypothetical protein VFZ69_16500 [Longimicrobiales bacterium]